MMANPTENDDLNDFLQRVDELEAVVKGDLTVSGDASVSGDVSGSGDQSAVRLENKKPVDRTVINHAAFKDDPASPLIQAPTVAPSMDQDGFMKAVERDAAERAQRRKEGKERATVWKDRGNVEFKAGNYEKAIEMYTEGLSHLRDFGLLYTNRAQAYNKLGQFDATLSDCDLILRLEPKNTKAHVHRGKALLGLHRYDDAVACYRDILAYDPKQQNLVDKYISDVLLARGAAEAEERASKALGEGDTHACTVAEVLQRLWKPDQNVMFYAGGLRLLAELLQDDNSRTLFRTGNGFDILTQTPLKSCITHVIEGEKRAESIEAVLSLLDVLTQVTINNDENCRVLVDSEGFPASLLGVLGCGHPQVSLQCVALLLRLTENPAGRQHLIERCDNASLLVGLFSFVQTSQSGTAEAAKVLNNLALEKRFTVQFRNKVDKEVLPAFEKYLKHHGSSKKSSAFPSCLSFMGNMAHDPGIRKQIASRKEFWEATISVLRSHSRKMSSQSNRDVIHALLGLLLNVTMETTQALKDQSESLSGQILPLLRCGVPELQERAARLLSRALPLSPGAVQAACSAGAPSTIVQALQLDGEGSSLAAAYSGCLATLTQTSEEARRQVIQSDPDLQCYRRLLTSESESVIANIALSMGHCVQLAGVSERLTSTEVVKTLLSRTDTTNETIKQNCAITLARLATSNKQHLEKLRELGGLGILHSCSKYALR